MTSTIFHVLFVQVRLAQTEETDVEYVIGIVWGTFKAVLWMVWGILEFIPLAQPIVIGVGIYVAYRFTPQPIRNAFRPVSTWIWNKVSPSLRWAARHVLRFTMRLAGEEVLKGSSPSGAKPDKVTVYKTSWKSRLRWSLVGAGATLAIQYRESVWPYASHAIGQIGVFVRQFL